MRIASVRVDTFTVSRTGVVWAIEGGC